ncbi:MAG: hypothetical protein ACAH95_09570 [Fimbriimonas sp.]
MEPESEEESPPQQISKARLIWRMAMLPIAFAWVAFMLSAPFALLDDRIAWGAVAFGLGGGIAVLIVQPKWAKKVLSTPPQKDARVRRTRPVDPVAKAWLTLFAASLAFGVGYFLLNSDFKDRSILAVFAVLLVIDMIRRPLRRAWGLLGSAAGLVISGGLIVLLLKAMSKGEEESALPFFAGILLMFEVFEEYRALKRMNPEPSPGESG